MPGPGSDGEGGLPGELPINLADHLLICPFFTQAALGSVLAVCALCGIAAFVVSAALRRRYEVRAWAKAEQNLTVLFPSTE
jgi:hypothetical protein